MRNTALWTRISDYEMPAGFVDRILDGTDWARTRVDASAALLEYRRFLYLAMVSDGEITPSRRVDDLWHLHLTDTEDYWHRLCPDVLGAPLHHRPTQMADTDADRHAAQYQRTLTLYAQEFGRSAPSAYWPTESVPGSKARSHVIHFGMLLTGLGLLISWGVPLEHAEMIGVLIAVIGIFISMAPVLLATQNTRRPRNRNGSMTFGGCSAGCGGGDCGGGD